MCGIVDANAKSVNSCKSQHEQKCEKVKRTKEIRAEMLRELKDEIRKVKKTYVIKAVFFNEDMCSKT